MSKKVLTLTLIHQHPNILLGLKKRGFGEGRWNGFGGKVSTGETIEGAARRELLEEAGIRAANLEKCGVLDFEFKGNPETLEVHVFKTHDFKGEPTESEEMKPRWFHVNEIPFHSMWPDDPHWFPLMLSDKKFRGKFLFEGHDKIIDKHLEEVEEI